MGLAALSRPAAAPLMTVNPRIERSLPRQLLWACRRRRIHPTGHALAAGCPSSLAVTHQHRVHGVGEQGPRWGASRRSTGNVR